MTNYPVPAIHFNGLKTRGTQIDLLVGGILVFRVCVLTFFGEIIYFYIHLMNHIERELILFLLLSRYLQEYYWHEIWEMTEYNL